MKGTRRTFMKTSAGIGLVGLLSNTVVGPAAATGDDSELHPTVDPILTVDGIEMSDSHQSVNALETIETFDSEPIQLRHIEVEMADGAVESVDIGDCSIPTVVDDEVKELGQQILDGESFVQTELSDEMREQFYPNLTEDNVETLPVDFEDTAPVVGPILLDIFDILPASETLSGILQFLCSIIGPLNGDGGGGGFLDRIFEIGANIIGGFVDWLL